MLRGVQHRPATGRTGDALGDRGNAGGRHVLELERDDVDPRGERARARRGRRKRRRLSTSATWPVGRVVVGREGVDAIAQPPRGDGEHAAELAAAEDADGRPRAGSRRVTSQRLRARTAHFARLLLAERPAAARADSGRVVGEDAPRRERGVGGARPCRWPASPTGTPPGIWTIDSSESRPLSAWLWTGTPSTGTVVCAATMPGRCAAPPAPAMITSSPRASAARGVLGHPVAACGAPRRRGTRAARRTRQHSAACRIVSQSDWLPMMTPTSGPRRPASWAECIRTILPRVERCGP